MVEKTYDLSAIFDDHVADEFAEDVAATMATMTAEPYVNHVPTMMGGVGAVALADFYEKYFIGHWPADTRIIPVCRTVGSDRVVDEMIMSFTHDIPTFLPGVAPGGSRSGVAFGAGRVAGREVPAGHRRRLGREAPRHGSTSKYAATALTCGGRGGRL